MVSRSLIGDVKRGQILFFLLFIISIDLFSQALHCQFNTISYPQARQAQTVQEDEGQIVAIPIVIHVLYSSTAQNISDDQIYSQIKVLNEDFNRRNADTLNTLPVFKLLAGSARVSFYITDKDAIGNKVTGITRTSTTHIPFHNTDIHFSAQGGEDAWDSRLFLNIWICDLADGVFGFASPPGTMESMDGVVIDHNYFGTKGTVAAPYHLGKTATHEVGHYLGLKHLWGTTGACMDDDGLSDTPPQYGPSLGCDLKRISCGGLNMVQNYMDTSDDQCMNLFTKDQVEEMRKNLFAARSGIIREDIITGVSNDPIKQISWINLSDKGEYKVTSPSRIHAIDIYNLQGQQCYLQYFPDVTFETNLHLSGLNGVFIIVIASEKETKTIRRYLK